MGDGATGFVLQPAEHHQRRSTADRKQQHRQGEPARHMTAQAIGGTNEKEPVGQRSDDQGEQQRSLREGHGRNRLRQGWQQQRTTQRTDEQRERSSGQRRRGTVVVHGALADFVRTRRLRLSVSVSDEQTMAMAFVVAEAVDSDQAAGA